MQPPIKKNRIQRVFITGLLILIPIVATIFVLIFLFNLLDGWLAPAGGQILRALGVKLPTDLEHIPGFGIAATFLLIFFTGLFASNFLGRKILQFGDKIIKRLPLVNNIYSTIRQVVTSFSIAGSKAFKQVVMFEYPRKGLWAIGFITTNSLPSVQRIAKQKMVNVFLPTTPNPTSGFLLMVPEKDVYPLPISPENGVKIIASVGLIQSETVLASQAAGIVTQQSNTGKRGKVSKRKQVARKSQTAGKANRQS